MASGERRGSARTRAIAAALAAWAAACGALPATPVSQAQGPRVDGNCVARAKAGNLTRELPPIVGAFHVRREADGSISLIHPGVALEEAEAKALWDHLGGEGRPSALSSGSSAISSVFRCPGFADTSCVHLSLWLCQTSLEDLAQALEGALAHIGKPTAELVARVTFEEQRGPSCSRGPACAPAAHYSQKNGRFEPSAPRYPAPPGGIGSCRDDGDCEGAESNVCQSWYLRGGAETAIFIQMSQPTFCGCVERQCTWFTQE